MGKIDLRESSIQRGAPEEKIAAAGRLAARYLDNLQKML